MINIIVGIFLVLHGLVHMLYFAQSARFFELQAGMLWPDGSWAFSKLLGDATTRMVAGIFCILVAAGFVIAEKEAQNAFTFSCPNGSLETHSGNGGTPLVLTF